MSLLHQGQGRASEDLEGDKPPPTLDQDLESNKNFQARQVVVNSQSLCALLWHRAQNEHVAEGRSYGLFAYQSRAL